MKSGLQRISLIAVFPFVFQCPEACTSPDEWTDRDGAVDEDEWTSSQEENWLFFKNAAGAYGFLSLYEPGLSAKNVELHTLKYAASCSSSVFWSAAKTSAKHFECQVGKIKQKQTNKKHFSRIFQIFLNPFFTLWPYVRPERTREVLYSGVTVSCAQPHSYC